MPRTLRPMYEPTTDLEALFRAPQSPIAASEIGSLFRKAREAHADTVRHLIEVGNKLREVRDSIPHGGWLLWVKQHESDLGFGERTARVLMSAALTYRQSTADLSDDEAAKLNRRIWGNERETSLLPRPASLGYFLRFLNWTEQHSLADVIPLVDQDETIRSQLRQRISDTRVWLDGLERHLAA